MTMTSRKKNATAPPPTQPVGATGTTGATGATGAATGVTGATGAAGAATGAAGAATASALPHVLHRWLATNSSALGKHHLHVMTEVGGARASVLDDLRDVVRLHYVSPAITAARLTALGAPKTAQLLREHLPTRKTARSGDLGEVLSTEIAEQTLHFNVPIRRLRWKDGREMALRGDDIIGVRITARRKLEILKGESKSRAELSTAVLDEAGEALDRDRGRPTRHAVLFVAERLHELGDGALAVQLETAVIESFKGIKVEHLLLALTGGNPTKLLTDHLTAAATKKRTRHAVGVRIADHGAFIAMLFGGM